MDQSIREELSNVTFEELLKIREKLGTKVYRHTVLNQLNKTENHEYNPRSNDNLEEDSEEKSFGQENFQKSKLNRKTKFNKRLDRSQPIEASSKKIDSRFNFQRIQPSDDLNQKRKAQTFRDPRFESQCGQFRSDKFEQNYAFLTDMRRSELETLKKKLRKAKSYETKEKIRFLIQRLSNQIKTDEEREHQKELKRKLRKQTQAKRFEVTNLNSNQESEPGNQTKPIKPRVFVNKSLIKRTSLVEKYKYLKQTGKLDKYLERKRKKLAAKDRSKIENATIPRNRNK